MEADLKSKNHNKRNLLLLIANAVIVSIILIFLVLTFVIIISTSVNGGVPSFGKTAAIIATNGGSTNFTFDNSGFANNEKIAIDVDKTVVIGDVIAYTVFYVNDERIDSSSENRVFIGKVVAVERNSAEKFVLYYLETDSDSDVSVFVESSGIIGVCILNSSATAQNILNLNSAAYLGLSISIPVLILIVANVLILLLAKEKTEKKEDYLSKSKKYSAPVYREREEYKSNVAGTRYAPQTPSYYADKVKHEIEKQNDSYEEIELDTGEVYDRNKNRKGFIGINKSIKNQSFFDKVSGNDSVYFDIREKREKREEREEKKNLYLDSPRKSENKKKFTAPKQEEKKFTAQRQEEKKVDADEKYESYRSEIDELNKDYYETIKRNKESAKEILYGKNLEQEEKIIQEVREMIAKEQQEELSAYLERAKLNRENAMTEKEIRNINLYGTKYLNLKKNKSKQDEKYKKFVADLINKEKKLKEQASKEKKNRVKETHSAPISNGPIVKNAVKSDNVHIEKRIPVSGSAGFVGSKSNLVFNPSISEQVKKQPSKIEIAYKKALKKQQKQKANNPDAKAETPIVPSKATGMLYKESYLDRAQRVNSNIQVHHTEIASKSEESANFSSRIDKLVKEERKEKENKKIADTKNTNNGNSASTVLKAPETFIPGKSKKKSVKNK